MQDAECVALLRWALPRLGLRWPGFRKVRRQVCKRINRRIKELGLADVAAYREHLERVPEEWPRLDALCRITISRFYRDRRSSIISAQWCCRRSPAPRLPVKNLHCAAGARDAALARNPTAWRCCGPFA
jgi:hypothetical protein